MCTLVARASGLVMALAIPLVAAGQDAPAPPATPPPPITAGWQDGFFLQSGNGDYRLVLGLSAQIDGRFVLDDPPSVINTFTLRKLRPTFSGHVAKFFDFRVVPEFGNGSTSVLDAYLDLRFSSRFHVRTGKDKTPIGYEALMGDPFLLFPERSLASNLIPGRDLGAQVLGDLAGSRLIYAGGVFNGILDGTNGTTELDANGGKDLAGRVLLQPFHSAQRPSSAAGGLAFHLGGSTGNQAGALPIFRTTSMQTFFSYATGTVASGRRNRVAPAVAYYHKSLGTFAEYTRSSQRVSRAAQTTDLTHQGWEVTGAYLVTGETATDREVHPSRPFDPAAGKWGALQLLVRYSELRVDPLAFTAGLASTASSERAHSVIAAANWYPVTQVKYYLFRAQVAF